MNCRLNILNLYYSSTGNTEKVSLRIQEIVQKLGHNIDVLKVSDGELDVDILKYDFVFVGSGVYGQLAGEPLMRLHQKLLQKYSRLGEIKYASPKRPNKRVVIYCTYGGVHTGINEAIPTVKYLGQLYDHLGYAIVGEWCVVGEYETERPSREGRLGDIRGRPNENDLKDIAGRVIGVIKASIT